MAKNPGCPVEVGVSHNRVARMKPFDYSWAGECHAVAMGIQDNEQASKLESRVIISAVEHDGTTRINISSTKGDGSHGTSGIPLSYSRSPDYDAQIYVAADTRPCSRDLGHDGWWALNPSFHMAKRDPNWVRKQRDPTKRRTRQSERSQVNMNSQGVNLSPLMS